MLILSMNLRENQSCTRPVGPTNPSVNRPLVGGGGWVDGGSDMQAGIFLARVRGLVWITIPVVAAAASGCDTQVLPPELAGWINGLTQQNADQALNYPGGLVTTPTGPGDFIPEQGTLHNTFDKPQPVAMRNNGTLTIQGRIDGKGDVDLYDLGPGNAGHLITVDVLGDNGLNTVAGLFDGGGNLIDASDDRSYYGGRLDPYISIRLPMNIEHVVVGIAVSGASYFSSANGRYDTGTYSVRVSHAEGNNTGPRPQVAWLDFAGGDSVQIGGEPIETMRPFSAESISGRLNGQTAAITEMIIQKMQHDFAAYNVTLFNSKHHTRPNGPLAKIYFGNFNRSFLGLADNVDTGNLVNAQEAIVYAEDVALFENLQPSAEEVAQCLANTGAHELGHLLGLEHTSDSWDVMSTAATARQVLENDASFLRAVLNGTVFPAGWQNNPTTLLCNVGPNPMGAGRVIISDPGPKPDTSFRDGMELSNFPVLKCGRCIETTCED